MGLFDSFSLFDDASDFGGLGTSILDIGQTVLGGFASNLNLGVPTSYPVQSFPQPMPGPAYPTAAGQVPMAARAAAAGIAAWSVRYPALWQALQKLRAQGTKATIEKLYSMLKSYGPATLSTVIGAAAVADLISYRVSHKRRRMNVANTHALRRSLRRLRGFDHLAGRVKMQLASSCRKKRVC